MSLKEFLFKKKLDDQPKRVMLSNCLNRVSRAPVRENNIFLFLR